MAISTGNSVPSGPERDGFDQRAHHGAAPARVESAQRLRVVCRAEALRQQEAGQVAAQHFAALQGRTPVRPRR